MFAVVNVKTFLPVIDAINTFEQNVALKSAESVQK